MSLRQGLLPLQLAPRLPIALARPVKMNGHVTDLASTPRVAPPAKSRLLRRYCELPPIPAVAVRLLGLLAKEEVGLGEVAAAVGADATIAAEVLRAANTAYYGIRGEVTSIRHATTLLGVARIRALAATVGLRRYLGQVLTIPAVERSWRHNLACAATAEQVALRLGGSAADAYMAGLLHDLGRLALAVAHPKQYPTLLDTTAAEGVALLAHERDLLGLDHCEAGQWFAAQLMLPQVFQDVAGYHHHPDAVGPTEILSRIATACALADWMGYWVTTGPDREAQNLEDLEARLHRLSPTERATLIADIPQLIADVDEQVQATESMFG